MKFKVVEELAVEQQDVSLSCKIYGVSRSGYYQWLNRPTSEKVKEDERLYLKIKESWEKSRGTYGSPRIHEDLKDEGERTSRKRVARLMRENGLSGAGKKKFCPKTTTSNHDLPVAPRLVKTEEMDVMNLSPGEVWAGDITYIPTEEGFCYLAVFLDLSSRKIVGHSVSDSLRTEVVLKALDDALSRNIITDCLVVHTDRGSQYAAGRYISMLNENGALPSMSRKGNCYDNAFVESFFRTLKIELVYRQKFKTIKEARQKIFEFIEVWYNRQRRHSSLDYLSPENYEKQIAFAS